MKLAVLDYLGTIDPDSVGAVMDARLWQPQPGILEAVAQLHHGGWQVVQAVNQPGLGLGSLDIGELNTLHQRLQRSLAAVGARMDAFFFCPHAPQEGCTCRKPAPGMLQEIANRYGALPHEMWVIGQCQTHIQAGLTLGAQVAWVQPVADQHPSCATCIPGDIPRYPHWQALAQALAPVSDSQS